MDFVDQLKSQVNIVSVIGQYMQLKKASRDRYAGLCPFHKEKTPSFSVSEGKQFYHCFGCHVSGDVLKFVMEIEGVSFYEALKSLAERHGIPMPKRSEYSDEDSKTRAALMQMHELAQEHFRANLHGSSGEIARAYLAGRGVQPETIEQFGLGYSLPSGRALLRVFEERQFPAAQMEASGLIGQREGGGYYDRFRNRLMFPIHKEDGKIIAFGGRALAADEKSKYLNSPETPIYRKSYTLYNLHRAKDAIRKEQRTILVEGYMDAIGVSAAGIGAVVASCGTALTAQQIQAIKRHAPNVVVNFDPDTAGANATEKSIGMLLEEDMKVRIMELDDGLDPDEYCKQRGSDAYREKLDQAKGYFHWLADGARKKYDIHTSEGVVSVLQFLLPKVQRISDRLERLAIAGDLASYIGVPPSMVLDSFRKSAADRQEKYIELPKTTVRPDERGLIAVLLSNAEGCDGLIEDLTRVETLDRLDTRRILQAIMAVHAAGARVTFDAVAARLEDNDRRILAEMLFAEDPAVEEFGIEWGRKCIERLLGGGERQRYMQLKARINELERAGKLEEAMRLMGELGRLGRGNSASRRDVQ
ncbi:MAG: DNA primase [Bryobacteraceae bacterium]|jgi:DNA primase